MKKDDGSALRLVSTKSIVPMREIEQYSMRFFVSSDLTNAEGNMTHYEYVKLFSQALEKFVGRKMSLQAIPAGMSFKYIKDILPGQTIRISVWLHDSGQKDSAVFMTEFTDCETGELHAVGVSEIYAQRREYDLQEQLKSSKAVTQCERFHRWMNAKRSRSTTANYVFGHKTKIYFGRTNFYGGMCSFEYANIFGEVREGFGLHCIPRFKQEAGVKYVLSTNEAHYIIMEKVAFGDDLHVKMWIEKSSGASFNLRAEFWNGSVLCAIAEQRIAYISLVTGKSGLPKSLKKQISITSGHSSLAFSFLRRVLNTVFMPIGRLVFR